MRKIILLIVFCLAIAGAVNAAAYMIEKEAGDLNVKVSMEKESPAVGESNLSITINDSDGKAVTGAKLKVNYTMPPMGNMPPMHYKARAKLDGETYKAKVNLSMPGKWDFTIAIKRPGKELAKMNFDMQVQ